MKQAANPIAGRFTATELRLEALIACSMFAEFVGSWIANRRKPRWLRQNTKLGLCQGECQADPRRIVQSPRKGPEGVLSPSSQSGMFLCVELAVGQHQWYYFGVGAPPILVYFNGDWDVHWGCGILTHGQVTTRQNQHQENAKLPRSLMQRSFSLPALGTIPSRCAMSRSQSFCADP